MKTAVRPLHAVFLFSALVLGACATVRGIDEHIRIDPADKTVIYRDQWVERIAPEVHVRPASSAPEGLRALFIPFRVSQQMQNPDSVGYGVARTVWQTWLTMRVFPSLEFSGDGTPYRRDRAVDLGRRRGADIVVGGFVTYIYAGGTAGDSQLALQVEVHDTRNGQMIWSMSQSGLIPASRTNDYFLFATKTRLPSDPMHAIAQAIASDMGKEIQDWISGPSPRSRMQQLDKDAQDLLLPPRDPVPPPRSGAARPADEGTKYTPAPSGAF
ncbi:MAG: hypothetical protein LBB52_08955 [Desulfovibrio sp.]|jgi:predicted small secreted protein|nr:hypothetical protein [Desulfovibrio sp.]